MRFTDNRIDRFNELVGCQVCEFATSGDVRYMKFVNPTTRKSLILSIQGGEEGSITIRSCKLNDELF